MASSRWIAFLLLAGFAVTLTSAILTPKDQGEALATTEEGRLQELAAPSELTGSHRNLLALSLERWLFGSKSTTKKKKSSSKKKAEKEEEVEEGEEKEAKCEEGEKGCKEVWVKDCKEGEECEEEAASDVVEGAIKSEAGVSVDPNSLLALVAKKYGAGVITSATKWKAGSCEALQEGLLHCLHKAGGIKAKKRACNGRRPEVDKCFKARGDYIYEPETRTWVLLGEEEQKLKRQADTLLQTVAEKSGVASGVEKPVKAALKG